MCVFQPTIIKNHSDFLLKWRSRLNQNRKNERTSGRSLQFRKKNCNSAYNMNFSRWQNWLELLCVSNKYQIFLFVYVIHLVKFLVNHHVWSTLQLNKSEYICVPLYMPILIFLKCLKRLCVYFIVLAFKKRPLTNE